MPQKELLKSNGIPVEEIKARLKELDEQQKPLSSKQKRQNGDRKLLNAFGPYERASYLTRVLNIMKKESFVTRIKNIFVEAMPFLGGLIAVFLAGILVFFFMSKIVGFLIFLIGMKITLDTPDAIQNICQEYINENNSIYNEKIIASYKLGSGYTVNRVVYYPTMLPITKISTNVYNMVIKQSNMYNMVMQQATYISADMQLPPKSIILSEIL
jgi:hypothetical protein